MTEYYLITFARNERERWRNINFMDRECPSLKFDDIPDFILRFPQDDRIRPHAYLVVR